MESDYFIPAIAAFASQIGAGAGLGAAASVGASYAGGTAALIGAATTAASIGTALYGMANAPGKMDSPGQPKDVAAEQAAYAQADAIKKRRGAASTVLTGPQGVTTPPNTLKSQLGA